MERKKPPLTPPKEGDKIRWCGIEVETRAEKMKHNSSPHFTFLPFHLSPFYNPTLFLIQTG
ncbi:hypothetical protein DDZ16_18115 [Marinilabilia rubra]|uniref:Uncharacterized protein n=1 Tax=Marinilabilia rubra TaxID=2162893 RepID=A0A2U2B4M1_9BACT|nr:hypothetical protein DDZ16_18115 [Marinilabilia rubra]